MNRKSVPYTLHISDPSKIMEGDIVCVRGRGVLHKILACTSGIAHIGIVYSNRTQKNTKNIKKGIEDDEDDEDDEDNDDDEELYVSNMSLKKGRCNIDSLTDCLNKWKYVYVIRLNDPAHLDNVERFRQECIRKWKYSWIRRKQHTYCTKHVEGIIGKSIRSVFPWGVCRLAHVPVYEKGPPHDTSALIVVILACTLLLVARTRPHALG